MPHARRFRQLPPLLSAALLLLALPAAATTYMMVDDATLAAQAPAIAEVSVESVDISPAKGWPATDYLVSVEQVIQGNLPGSSLIVRVPGGQRPDGWGSRSGERRSSRRESACCSSWRPTATARSASST